MFKVQSQTIQSLCVPLDHFNFEAIPFHTILVPTQTPLP